MAGGVVEGGGEWGGLDLDVGDCGVAGWVVGGLRGGGVVGVVRDVHVIGSVSVIGALFVVVVTGGVSWA